MTANVDRAKAQGTVDLTKVELEECDTVEEPHSIPHFNSSLPVFPCMKKPLVVKAVQVDFPFKVKSKEGMVEGNPGDYLMIGIEGERYICEKSIFEKSYDFVGGCRLKEE